MQINGLGGGKWRPLSGCLGLASAVPIVLGAAMSAGSQCPAGAVPGLGLPGTGGSVEAIVVLPNGDAIVGGTFRADQGAPGNSIARYSPESGTWVGLGGGMNRGSSVLALTTLPGGEIIAGGTFISAGGLPANKVARFSPTTGTWSGMGTLPTDNIAYILAVAVLSDGDVVAAGAFSTIGGVSANNIARYSMSTGAWSPMGTGTSSPVTALTVVPGGDVVAGGWFTTAGGIAARTIARYSPASGAWSAMSNGLGGDIFDLGALATLPSGDVVATGRLYLTEPAPVERRIARYSMSAATWEPMGMIWPAGAGIVHSLAVLPNGELVAGGDSVGMTTGNANSNGPVVLYDPATESWTTLVSATQPVGGGRVQVTALAASADGNVFVGGNFGRLGYAASSRFGMYAFGDPPPQFGVWPDWQRSECPERSATFGITPAPNEGATYQWQREGVAIDATANPSAATATLVLTNLGPDDAGEYRCIITDGCGRYTSDSAWLQVDICPCTVADIAGGGMLGLEADGTLDGSDFIAFMNSFSIGDRVIDAVADIAGDGADGLTPDGVIDGTDFVTFINSFAAGC